MGEFAADAVTTPVVPGHRAPWIFISYRKSLSAETALHLFHELENHYPGHVFFDTESLPQGLDWDMSLAEALRHPELRVVVCVIHPDTWTHAKKQGDVPRLWNPDDVLLDEFEQALDRRDNGDLRLILALQHRPPGDGGRDESLGSVHARTPRREDYEAPGIPERTRKVLERLSNVQARDSFAVTDTLGLKALVELIVQAVTDVGAQSYALVRTVTHLEALARQDGSRGLHEFQVVLEEEIRRGHRDTRRVALAAMIQMMLDGDYAGHASACASWRSRARSSSPPPRTPRNGTGGPSPPSPWRALTATGSGPAAWAASASPGLVADVLGPTLVALDRAGDVTLASDVAKELGDIITDYFKTRGVSISSRGPIEDDALTAGIQRLMDSAHARRLDTPITTPLAELGRAD